LFGDGEGVLVVGLGAGEAEVAGEVAEDLGYRPDREYREVGSGRPAGVG